MKSLHFIVVLLFFIATPMTSWGKSYDVSFHEEGNNLVIAFDETPEALFSEFYFVKLISPLNKSLFVDGKYKVSVKKGVLVLASKERTLILTTDKSVIQTAFRQKGTYYILVNAIASGRSDGLISAEDIIYSVRTNKPFEQEFDEINLGEFQLKLVSRNKNYFENLELGYF